MAKPRNVRPVLTYLTQQQKETLDRLHELSRIPRTVLLREAVDDLIVKYARVLKPRSKS